MIATDRWLDQGMGSCVLRRVDAREILVESLKSFDSAKYELGAFVAMPNHVHAVIRPLEEHALEMILKRCKQWTSGKINRLTNRSGSLWQQESYDRIVRDSEHLWRVIQYIGKNPGKAGIGKDASTRWVHPNWLDQGWSFLDE